METVSLTLTSVLRTFRAAAAATVLVASGMTPTLAIGPIGPQVRQTETPPNNPNGKAPIAVPATSPSTPAAETDNCTPTTGLLRFDGGYEVSMCYVTPDGDTGQAKAGLYASAESGLLWFFSRENAEVLVKVLNGCAINGYRWVFTAPVTTLEFDLWVTSPTGVRWTHGNTQGVTAATKSDVAAFACADEPGAAQDLMAPPSLPAFAARSQTQTTPNSPNSPNVDAPTFVPVPLTQASTPDCTPTTSLLHFDGGYEVSMCYVTPDGETGQAKAGLYASAESGLLWFFSRDNAEVLVKVLNGCDINGHRWVFVAPVTTLEFDLRVTSPTGVRWSHGNTQGETAATRSDTAAFACADEPEAAPDLIVSSVSASDPNPVAGQNITFRATVRNRGDAPATPTTLRYYQSTDSTISTSDDLLASDTVPALSASATESMTLDFTTPSTPGTFYLGACIDPFSAESQTGNNCSDGVQVVVDDDPHEPEAAPDLIVSSVSVSDANPVAGQNIAFRATVRNRGDAPATPTTLRYYQSTDSTISTSDDLLASDTVPALSASATESMTLDFTTPSTPGTFYLGACIDSVSGESTTGNNCSTGVRVVAEEEPDEGPDDDPDDDPEAVPDLVVSVSVSDANPVAGQNIEFRVTVRNRGDGPAPPTTIHYYVSEDATISTSDTLFESVAVSALAPGAAESMTYQITAAFSGTFYLGACIDPVSAESDTSNNCSDSVPVTVEEPAPDLTVSSVSPTDQNPVSGAVIDIHVTVLNSGDAPSSATTIRYYESDDATINTTFDRLLGDGPVPALPASGTASTVYDGFTIGGLARTFYLGACIDPVSAESDTRNNCSDGVPVTVEERQPEPAPDLTVFSATVDNQNPASGDQIQFHVTVLNSGDAPSSATTIRYYESNDAIIDKTSDRFIGDDPVPVLPASNTVSTDLELVIDGSPRIFYLGACIDPSSTESDTRNNCSDSVPVTVQ